jgi:3-oxoacyl-[acyl-carrier protein] reductase
MRLADRSTVVTGAAAGIGRAIAQAFAREGAHVLAADVNERGGRETVDSIVAEGGDAVFLPTDVTRREDLRRLLDAALERHGRLDVLVNNAGIGMPMLAVEDADEALVDRLLAINLKAVFVGCQLAAPIMKAQRRGVILNLASIGAIRPRAQQSAYVMTKGGVVTLTKSLALELAPFGVRVVSICPVVTDTAMLDVSLPGLPPEEVRKRFVASVPLGRLNRPEDVANAALWAASDDAAMLTGTALEIDGGRAV